MTIDGHECIQRKAPGERFQRRIQNWMNTPERDKPGYWVKWWPDLYIYREHTGDITYWTTKGT